MQSHNHNYGSLNTELKDYTLLPTCVGWRYDGKDMDGRDTFSTDMVGEKATPLALPVHKDFNVIVKLNMPNVTSIILQGKGNYEIDAPLLKTVALENYKHSHFKASNYNVMEAIQCIINSGVKVQNITHLVHEPFSNAQFNHCELLHDTFKLPTTTESRLALFDCPKSSLPGGVMSKVTDFCLPGVNMKLTLTNKKSHDKYKEMFDKRKNGVNEEQQNLNCM